jgi:hypothetical protein
LSVNDQSTTWAVTGSPLSQSPGALHAKDDAFGQSLGSKPVKRSTTSSKIKQTSIDPPIFTRNFNSHLLDGKRVLSEQDSTEFYFPERPGAKSDKSPNRTNTGLVPPSPRNPFSASRFA